MNPFAKAELQPLLCVCVLSGSKGELSALLLYEKPLLHLRPTLLGEVALVPALTREDGTSMQCPDWLRMGRAVEAGGTSEEGRVHTQ